MILYFVAHFRAEMYVMEEKIIGLALYIAYSLLNYCKSGLRKQWVLVHLYNTVLFLH